jgi:hypothetical protein
MIELAEGIFIAPEHVSMIRQVDENSCLLFTVGQSALEGHLLPYPASEVAEVIEESFCDDEDEDVEDEEE